MTEYATDKLGSHPETVELLRRGKSRLTSVHLMPQNVCNHSCSFCSYRLEDNKNSEVFNAGVHIPLEDMAKLLADFQGLGVQGVEVTGGGEPLAYPHTLWLWDTLKHHGFATALVTNGTLLTQEKAEAICASRLKWVRVSIDAATPETYSEMRKCPESHFAKAWEAVRQFREHAPRDPEFRLGVGFVLDNHNMREVVEFVKLAKDSGADNVRLSSTFSDQNMDYFADRKELMHAVADSLKAEDVYANASFRVNNLIPKRLRETEQPYQDYKRCFIKDVLCVVEGECKVYTCCTYTGSKKGCYGKFTEHPGGFRGLWEENEGWRSKFDARTCDCACLYRDRNLAMAEIVDGLKPVGHLHKGFI